ncbi:MAG: stage V sporulation protein AC [Clostridia bacterium]
MSSKVPDDAKSRYARDAARYRPRPPYLRNFLAAFFVGGAICAAGQVLHSAFVAQGLDDVEAGARMAAALIAVGALLTGLGVYDSLGRFAGAGSAIPISGFANSIVAPAMEFAREGYVLGMAAQMFVVAGPVIVYGVLAAFLSAAVRYLVLGTGG